MAEKDAYSGALRSMARMEGDAIERARVAGEQARAEASKPGGEPAVLSVPVLGPYLPPTPGELAGAAVGAGLLARLEALDAERWRVSLPLTGGGR